MEKGLRVRIHVMEFEEEFFIQMPCRVNVNDEFFLDEFVDEGIKQILSKDLNDLLESDSHHVCKEVLWCKDELGIFQSVFVEHG